jgi:hypothetical protein
LIATFHPELTSDATVHEYFLRDVANQTSQIKSDASTAALKFTAARVQEER